MMESCRINLTLLWIIFWFFLCLSLSWCWDSWLWTDSLSVSSHWFDLNYNGNSKFERVSLKTDDLDEIVDLYQEVWDGVWYRDSLLIAEKYAQWFWANAFAQKNLDTLVNQWLTLSDINKTQIRLNKYWNNIYAVLVEYKIENWLLDEIPVLYVNQLFIPDDKNIILMSFITENKSSSSSASNMFKNIK